MDAVRVSALRESLAGTGWIESTRAFAGALRHSVTRRSAGGLLLVGDAGYEPWHLAAHLADEAERSGVPRLAPTLLRHTVPPGAPAHLAHGLTGLAAAGRGATVLVTAPGEAGPPLLERVLDARRAGATVLTVETGDRELAALAHESLTVEGAAGEPFELVQHLVCAAAGERAARGGSRLAALARRLTAPPVARW